MYIYIQVENIIDTFTFIFYILLLFIHSRSEFKHKFLYLIILIHTRMLICIFLNVSTFFDIILFIPLRNTFTETTRELQRRWLNIWVYGDK